MLDEEHLPLLRATKDGPTEKFEKDPEGLDVGIDIKNLVKIYNGETGMNCVILSTSPVMTPPLTSPSIPFTQSVLIKLALTATNRNCTSFLNPKQTLL